MAIVFNTNTTYIASFEVKMNRKHYFCYRMVSAPDKAAAKQAMIDRNPDHHLFYLKLTKATRGEIDNAAMIAGRELDRVVGYKGRMDRVDWLETFCIK